MSARALFLLSAAFIAYATTIPWDTAPPPDWSRVQWTPFEGAWGVPDAVQNVVLFVPFGVFGFFALRRALLVAVLGGALSALVEFLQTMSPTRTASATDVATNLLGAFSGAAFAAMIARPLEERWLPAWRARVRRQPGSTVLVALLLAAVWQAWAPFLPTLDVGAFKQQAKGFLADPWGGKPWELLLFDAVLYAGLGVAWFRELRFPAGAFLLAGALEFGQFFLRGHAPALQDVAAAWAGLAAGAAVVRRTGPGPAREAGELVRRFPGLCLAFALALPALRALEPFRFGPWAMPDAWRFVPFASVFANVNAFTVANFFTVIAAYVPLGYVLPPLATPTDQFPE